MAGQRTVQRERQLDAMVRRGAFEAFSREVNGDYVIRFPDGNEKRFSRRDVDNILIGAKAQGRVQTIFTGDVHDPNILRMKVANFLPNASDEELRERVLRILVLSGQTDEEIDEALVQSLVQDPDSPLADTYRAILARFRVA